LYNLRCKLNRSNHARRIGTVLSRDIKSSAVINRCTHNWKTRRHTDSPKETPHLRCDMPLVVIQRNDSCLFSSSDHFEFITERAPIYYLRVGGGFLKKGIR
jgi:hypothetical protein